MLSNSADSVDSKSNIPSEASLIESLKIRQTLLLYKTGLLNAPKEENGLVWKNRLLADYRSVFEPYSVIPRINWQVLSARLNADYFDEENDENASRSSNDNDSDDDVNFWQSSEISAVNSPTDACNSDINLASTNANFISSNCDQMELPNMNKGADKYNNVNVDNLSLSNSENISDDASMTTPSDEKSVDDFPQLHKSYSSVASTETMQSVCEKDGLDSEVATDEGSNKRELYCCSVKTEDVVTDPWSSESDIVIPQKDTVNENIIQSPTNPTSDFVGCTHLVSSSQVDDDFWTNQSSIMDTTSRNEIQKSESCEGAAVQPSNKPLPPEDPTASKVSFKNEFSSQRFSEESSILPSNNSRSLRSRKTRDASLAIESQIFANVSSRKRPNRDDQRRERLIGENKAKKEATAHQRQASASILRNKRYLLAKRYRKDIDIWKLVHNKSASTVASDLLASNMSRHSIELQKRQQRRQRTLLDFHRRSTPGLSPTALSLKKHGSEKFKHNRSTLAETRRLDKWSSYRISHRTDRHERSTEEVSSSIAQILRNSSVAHWSPRKKEKWNPIEQCNQEMSPGIHGTQQQGRLDETGVPCNQTMPIENHRHNTGTPDDSNHYPRQQRALTRSQSSKEQTSRQSQEQQTSDRPTATPTKNRETDKKRKMHNLAGKVAQTVGKLKMLLTENAVHEDGMFRPKGTESTVATYPGANSITASSPANTLSSCVDGTTFTTASSAKDVELLTSNSCSDVSRLTSSPMKDDVTEEELNHPNVRLPTESGMSKNGHANERNPSMNIHKSEYQGKLGQLLQHVVDIAEIEQACIKEDTTAAKSEQESNNEILNEVEQQANGTKTDNLNSISHSENIYSVNDSDDDRIVAKLDFISKLDLRKVGAKSDRLAPSLSVFMDNNRFEREPSNYDTNRNDQQNIATSEANVNKTKAMLRPNRSYYYGESIMLGQYDSIRSRRRGKRSLQRTKYCKRKVADSQVTIPKSIKRSDKRNAGPTFNENFHRNSYASCEKDADDKDVDNNDTTVNEESLDDTEVTTDLKESNPGVNGGKGAAHLKSNQSTLLERKSVSVVAEEASGAHQTNLKEKFGPSGPLEYEIEKTAKVSKAPITGKVGKKKSTASHRLTSKKRRMAKQNRPLSDSNDSKLTIFEENSSEKRSRKAPSEEFEKPKTPTKSGSILMEVSAAEIPEELPIYKERSKKKKVPTATLR